LTPPRLLPDGTIFPPRSQNITSINHVFLRFFSPVVCPFSSETFSDFLSDRTVSYRDRSPHPPIKYLTYRAVFLCLVDSPESPLFCTPSILPTHETSRPGAAWMNAGPRGRLEHPP